MADNDLSAAVEAQARAHLAGDAPRFASHMTPAALVELGRSAVAVRGVRPKRYRVLDITSDGDDGASAVRYEGAGSYVVRQRWQRTAAGWKAVAAEHPPELVRRPWWRRLLPGGAPAEAPPRRELR
ncbi:MAG: hypothetical protein KGK07_05885 [Chloroflexota bacterium]|nr:hypothetical protein [Chloroflexota bacterium]